jgi:hypothetical protein
MHVEKTAELRPPPLESSDDAARVFVPTAEATQEVRLEDVLESIDLKTGRIRSSHPSSIAPIAIDVRRSYATFGPEDSLDGVRRPPPRKPPSRAAVVTVACAMGLCVVILGAAGVRTLVGERAPEIAKTNALTPAVAAASPSKTDPGALDVNNLPPASVSATGTIVFPRRTTATLDGARVTAGSAIVRCGEHTVRLGRAAPRKVVVPCGGTIAADGSKTN